MNKPRLFLSLIISLFLIGVSLLLWPGHRNTVPSVVAYPPVSHAERTPKLAGSGKPAQAVAFPVPAQKIIAGKSDSLAIGSLLADSSLDNKAVITGLAAMTLETGRSLEERTEAMGHLLDLSVEDPSPVLLPLVSDTRLPDVLCDQILDDALNGSLSWQADASLAALTHRDGKEIQTKAREHLVFLMGTDHGENIAEWSKAIALSKEKWAQAQKQTCIAHR